LFEGAEYTSPATSLEQGLHKLRKAVKALMDDMQSFVVAQGLGENVPVKVVGMGGGMQIDTVLEIVSPQAVADDNFIAFGAAVLGNIVGNHSTLLDSCVIVPFRLYYTYDELCGAVLDASADAMPDSTQSMKVISGNISGGKVTWSGLSKEFKGSIDGRVNDPTVAPLIVKTPANAVN